MTVSTTTMPLLVKVPQPRPVFARSLAESADRRAVACSAKAGDNRQVATCSELRPDKSPVETASLQSNHADADADTRRLAAAIGRGDETAFREFYERYHPRLFRFALVLARGDETLAHDAVQTAFVTAARKLHAVESKEHLWNWLARVARQHLAKSRRQLQRDSAVVVMADLPDCADVVETDTVLEETLDAALATMDADERGLVEWFYFDRLSHKEIADKLGATPKSVSSRLERARAKLRAAVTRKLSHET